MKKSNHYGLAVFALLSISTSAVLAETVTFAATGTGGTKTAAPLYMELSSSWAYQGAARSTAPGMPAGSGCRSTPSAGAYAEWSITPTLATAGGSYVFQISHGAWTGGSTDVVVNISVSGGTLANGSTPVTSTTAWQQTGANTWETVGTLKLAAGVTQPTITFSTSGSYTKRVLVDGFQFTSASGGCESGLPAIEAVKGPLAAGQTTVTVPDVDATATKITVYANNVQIGQRTTGIVAGENIVPVTALVKGQSIIATQTNSSGVESCKPTTGGIVGGGANPNIRVVLNIRENQFIGGPIGADGTYVPGDPFFLGSGAPVNGKGTAPSGGRIITPGYCWQTVSFDRATDPVYDWTDPFPDPQIVGDYGILDGIGFALEGGDNGPYVVYIDNVMNGGHLLEDFENGSGEIMFTRPSTSTWTNQYLMPVAGPVSPDFGEVVAGTADSGNQSFAAYWQFKDLSTSNWLLLLTYGTDRPQPVVDLSLPISFRLLVLPLGALSETGPTITDPPHSAKGALGGSVTFHVAATGSGTLTYQWYVNGTPAGTNSNSFTLYNLTQDHNGTHVCVTVCDATGSTRSPDAIVWIPCRANFADTDNDQDVDMKDFAAFQACFLGAGVYVAPGTACACFDRDPTGPDQDVDADDLIQFLNCFTGPSVLWSQALAPNCVP